MIYLRETQDRGKFVKYVLSLELNKQIQSINKVLIKPNIVSYESYPSTTHPIVLQTCLDYFLAHKKDVVVTDGPAPDAGDSKQMNWRKSVIHSTSPTWSYQEWDEDCGGGGLHYCNSKKKVPLDVGELKIVRSKTKSRYSLHYTAAYYEKQLPLFS